MVSVINDEKDIEALSYETSKYDLETELFRENFAALRSKSFAIYGIGRRTLALLPHIKDFHIIGLLDRDPANLGRMIHGVPVISLEDAEKSADLVVVNSDSSNFDVIYRRIAGIKIPVYYADGREAQIEGKLYQENPYWERSVAQLEMAIATHDVISFDFFDTLVMRSCLDPSDVKYFSSEEDVLEVEKRVLLPRCRMIEMFRLAQELGKDVYIVSDTEYPSRYYDEFLEAIGLSDFPREKVWLSSEYDATKESGELWKIFVASVNADGIKTILHVGDNYLADGKMAKMMGIDTFLVMSAKDMLKNSSLSDLLLQVKDLGDSVALGLIIAEMFNDPFALSVTKGRPYFGDAGSFGYVVLGSVITRFTSWLAGMAEQKNYEALLFFARDGYFLKEDFDFWRSLKGGLENLATHYFPGSRRVLSVASMETADDLQRVAAYAYGGTFADYLRSRFGISADSRSAEYNGIGMDELKCMGDVLQYLKPYEKEIWCEAYNERRNLRLLMDSLGVSGRRFATVDFTYYGRSHFYFQKFLGKKIDGYSFYRVLHNSPNSYPQARIYKRLITKYRTNMHFCVGQANIHKKAHNKTSCLNTANM